MGPDRYPHNGMHHREASGYLPPLRFRFRTRLYDALVRLASRERAVTGELVRRAKLRNAEHALDLGCGSGTLSVALALAYRDAAVTGLDADLHALVLAQKKAKGCRALVNLEHGLAQHLPFEASSFDLVVSSLLFHHLDQTEKYRALFEARRITKPGGRLLIADWEAPTSVVSRLLLRLVRTLDGLETTCDHVTRALPALIRQAGFDDVREVQAISTALGVIHIVEALRAGSTSDPCASEMSTVRAGAPVWRPSCTSR